MNATRRRRRRTLSLPRDDTIEETVVNAERALVLKNYREALKLSISVLSETEQHVSNESTNNQDNCVSLMTPIDGITGEPGSLVISMSTNVSPVDRAAAVALQVSRSDSDECDGQQAFLKYYSCHKMPIDVAILWIQYLFSNKALKAVELTAEILHYSRQEPNVADATDELALTFCTKMLAFCKNADYVRDVLDRIEAPSWVSGSYEYSRDQQINEQAVSTLLQSRFEKLLSSTSARNEWRQHLQRKLIVEEEIMPNDSSSQSHYDSAMVESNASHSITAWKNLFESREWPTIVATRILHYFRIRIVEPLYKNENARENRRQVALSALLLYLAWRRRRRYAALTASAAHILVSPFREIIEALLPQR